MVVCEVMKTGIYHVLQLNERYMQQERYSLETNIEIQNVFKLEIFKNERVIEILIL
jgi:hypothetical protein